MEEDLYNREKIGGRLPRTPTRTPTPLGDVEKTTQMHLNQLHAILIFLITPITMTIRGLSLHHGNTESRKSLEQKYIFQLGTLSAHEINERF